MSDIVILNDSEGKACMIYPTPNATKKQTLDEYATNLLHPSTSYDIVDATVVPADFYFRNAWTWNSTTQVIDIDMTKAKVIHLEKLKIKRKEKWKTMGVPENINPSLDSSFSAGDQQTLSDLRDLENYDLSPHTTPETLKADVPSYLV